MQCCRCMFQLSNFQSQTGQQNFRSIFFTSSVYFNVFFSEFKYLFFYIEKSRYFFSLSGWNTNHCISNRSHAQVNAQRFEIVILPGLCVCVYLYEIILINQGNAIINFNSFSQLNFFKHIFAKQEGKDYNVGKLFVGRKCMDSE